MASLEDITAEATVEALLENTLRSVQEALSSAAAVLSTDWLADSRLRDKLMFELRRVTNCQQLQSLYNFCLRMVSRRGAR